MYLTFDKLDAEFHSQHAFASRGGQIPQSIIAEFFGITFHRIHFHGTGYKTSIYSRPIQYLRSISSIFWTMRKCRFQIYKLMQIPKTVEALCGYNRYMQSDWILLYLKQITSV
jgi:hypothetical protein